MKPARWLLLLVAVLAGGLAAYLATRGADPAPVPTTVTATGEQALPASAPQEQILIATAAIGLGQRLSPELVTWTPWPADAVRPEYVVQSANPEGLEQITGAVARIEIFPGEPVSEGKLVRSDQGYLSAVLSKGFRAFSIPVTADASAGGFVVPNDRVDVVVTSTNTNPPISETVLTNVRVLAIGKRLGESGTTGAPADPSIPEGQGFEDASIATLELTQQQGEILASAKARGPLSLALRSVADFGAADQLPQITQSGVRVIRAGKQADVAQVSSAASEVSPSVTTVETGADYAPTTTAVIPVPELE